MDKDNRAEFEGIPCWEVITGSSFGGFSDREMVIDMAKAMSAVGEDTAKIYKELAECTDDDIDIDWFTDLAVDALCAHTPEYTYMSWRDNELIVMPDVEEAQHCEMSGSETPERGDYTGQLFLKINERGNVALYRWVDSVTGWRELWSRV